MASVVQNSRRNSGRTGAVIVSRTGRVMPVGHPFKPGQSGNPAGRPPTVQIRKELKAHLAEAVRHGKTHLRKVIEALVAVAESGDVSAYNSIRDTVDGRPVMADERERADRDQTPHVTVNILSVLGTLPVEALDKLRQAAIEAEQVRERERE